MTDPAPPRPADPGLLVLNPRGRDPAQSFADGPGDPDELAARGLHPPVNHHGYAACRRGLFLVDPAPLLGPAWRRSEDPAAAAARRPPVLLLLRRRLEPARRWLPRLRAAGWRVAVTFKETGASQVAARLADPGALARWREILRLADGFLAPTAELAALAGAAAAADAASAPSPPRPGPGHGAGRRRPTLPVGLVPTPYPLAEPGWDFGVSPAARRGLFVGTREFATPARQHLAAVLLARQLAAQTGDYPVTVVNAEGRAGLRTLAALGFSDRADAPLRLVPGRLAYPDYLRLVARHKLVWQLDRSAVPGQVAGDALLCRVPCVGGDGTVERTAFASCCGHGRDPGELRERARALLADPGQAAAVTAQAQAAAARTLAFPVVAARLTAFFADLEPGNHD